MRHQSILLLLSLSLVCFPAFADESAEDVENDYAASILNRPMVLPRGLGQLWGGFEFNRNSNRALPIGGTDITPQNSTRMGLGYDHGVGADFQLGGSFEVQLSPDSRLMSALIDAQYRLSPSMNARLDVGTRRLPLCGSSDQATMVGFGLPLKLPIAAHAAFVSGSTLGADPWQDLFVWDSRSCNGAGIVHLPFGFLFQSDEVIAFHLGAGYRTLFGGDAKTTHFIPLKLEGIMTFEQRLDIAFGVQFPGKFGASSNDSKREYELFETRLYLWAAQRF